MKKTHKMLTAGVSVIAGITLSLGMATEASATPQTQSNNSSSTGLVSSRFSLLVPNAPVTFAIDQNLREPGAPTVEGKQVVGTGMTDERGDTAFAFTPSTLGLAPGTYRLIAATNVPGFASHIQFGVK